MLALVCAGSVEDLDEEGLGRRAITAQVLQFEKLELVS